MVQVPTSSAASSAHANRASSANTTRSGTPSKGKGQANGISNGNATETKQEKAAAPVLLSVLRAEPLDLSTVERRSLTTPVQDLPKKNRIHGLQDAPTYYPTKEEYSNPYEYIKKIAPEARQYGICKIVPPSNWHPEFAIDTEVWLSEMWHARLLSLLLQKGHNGILT